MEKQCIECGKEIKEETGSLYCAKCDEKLDKQFETIEDNILIYKELTNFEIEILNKFEKEDIVDLYLRVYGKFQEKGDLTGEEIMVLRQMIDTFGISESEIGKDKMVEETDVTDSKVLDKDRCPDCGKDIKEDFNLCPYCGYRLKL